MIKTNKDLQEYIKIKNRNHENPNDEQEKVQN